MKENGQQKPESTGGATAQNDIQRSVLPISDRKPIGFTTFDAKDPDTKFPPIPTFLPPKGPPNVLVILLDGVGSGASTACGGPINIPNDENLAGDVLKYNRKSTLLNSTHMS